MRRSGVQNEWRGGRAVSRKLGQERQRESPPTGWPTGVMGMDARSLVVWLRGAQPLDGSLVDEAAETKVEEGAQLDELVHPHLALPV